MEQAQLQLVLDYIETHLKDELDNETLAYVSGYSAYHFIRVFRKYVHLTPADYIRKRRISEIVLHVGDKSVPISDVAFAYGFNSKENFTRAFKNEHGILPTQWKKANCSLKLFMPFSFEHSDPQPAVSLQYIEEFTLAAYQFDEDPPPKCWNKYNAEKRSLRLSGRDDAEDFGVMMWNSEKGRLNYYIGIKANAVNGDEQNTLKLQINGGLYAVFETQPVSQHDFVSTIRSTWDWIYRQWLPDNGYERAEGFELESYIESSRKFTERIYVPIRKE